MERQTISRFIRQNIAGLLVGVTLGAITTGAITAASVTASGNVTVGGTLNVTGSATLAGGVSGTTGTFSGAVSTGALTPASVASAGAVSGTTGTFSSTVTATGAVRGAASHSLVGASYFASPVTLVDGSQFGYVNTTETTIATFTIPANTWVGSAKRLEVEVFAQLTANTNTKNLRVKLNGTAAGGTCNFNNASDNYVSMRVVIHDRGTNQQDAWVRCQNLTATGSTTGYYGQPTATETSDITVTITGETPSSGSDMLVRSHYAVLSRQ